MEILKVGELLQAAINIKALLQIIDPNQNLHFLERDHKDVLKFVSLICDEAEKFDLVSTLASARRLKEILEQCAINDHPQPTMTTYNMIDADRIRGYGNDMTGRLADDIAGRTALVLPPSKSAFLTQQLQSLDGRSQTNFRTVLAILSRQAIALRLDGIQLASFTLCGSRKPLPKNLDGNSGSA